MPGLPDPTQWVKDLFPQAVAALLSALTFGLSAAVNELLRPDSPINFIVRTPPGLSYESPSVATLWEAMRLIANAALAAVVVWVGFDAMARPCFGSTCHEVMELVPRVVLGAILANTSRDWCQLAIDFNNAFCAALGDVTPPGWDQTPAAGQVLTNIISGLIYVAMGLLLALQTVMRLALVDLLLVVAPRRCCAGSCPRRRAGRACGLRCSRAPCSSSPCKCSASSRACLWRLSYRTSRVARPPSSCGPSLASASSRLS
jgi:hypothetical protein